MDMHQPIRSIDVTGKHITTFILHEVVNALDAMAEGDILEVRTDDFEAIDTDLRAWAKLTGHRMIVGEPVPGGYRYLFEKGEHVVLAERMAVVISDDGLEELLSPLGMALAAALEGIHVSVFFQGPGVRVLRKGFRARLKGVRRIFSRMAARGLERTGHVEPQRKVRELRELGAELLVCGPSLEHEKIERGQLVFSDVTIAEYATMVARMAEADIQIYA